VGKIRERGLELITGEGTYRLDVPAVASAEDVGFREGDVVLLCVKSQDTERALAEIRAAGGDPQTLPILCCQNSITNEPVAARFFRRVYGVLIVIPGVYLEDGVVHNPIRGNAGFLEIGSLPRGQDDLAAEAAGALSRASYAAFANPDVMPAKAAKMLGNLGNAMGAITDGKGDSRPYMARVRREALACFEAAGVPCEDRERFEARARQNRGETALPPGVRNLGSSWQSLRRRQGTIEADYLNGEIVRLGRLHEVATPFNEVLQEVASAMAARGEQPGKLSAEDLTALAEARAD
jgi:2-dehydropantoate 2-reductase